MILKITKNNNKLELTHSNYNISTCDITENMSINPSLCKTTNPYGSVIQKIKDDVHGVIKIIIDKDLIENYSKEIMLLLSHVNIIKPWDEKFWSKINNHYTPALKAIKEYLSSL